MTRFIETLRDIRDMTLKERLILAWGVLIVLIAVAFLTVALRDAIYLSEKMKEPTFTFTEDEQTGIVSLDDLGLQGWDYGISLSGHWGDLDVTAPTSYFMHADDDWVLTDVSGRKFVRAKFADKSYRIFLEEEK